MADVDIEDLAVKACLHDCRVETPIDQALSTPRRRLAALASHLVGDKASKYTGCHICPLHVAASSSSGAQPELQEVGRPIAAAQPRPQCVEDAGEFPIKDPFGSGISLEELCRIRRSDDELRKVQEMEASLPPQDFQRKDEWPYTTPWEVKTMNPRMMTAEVNGITGPILRRLVDNVRNKTNDMPYEPTVLNAWDTFVDPGRFAAEVEAMKSGYAFAGLSSDLGGKPNDFRRVELLGKSVLLTRDPSGRFRAFENICRHRGMELVRSEHPRGNRAVHVCGYHSWAFGSDGQLVNVPFEQGFEGSDEVALSSRNLIELPAGERCGILFVVSHPRGGAHYADLLEDILSPELARELDAYHLEDFKCVITQTISVASNWKLPIDTFGEAYHFNTLHPNFSQFVLGNRTAFRGFDDRRGHPRNSCMTLTKQSVEALAGGGIPEERWNEPCAMHHMIQTFVIAPNISLIVGSQDLTVTQSWPGEGPGECVVTLAQYSTRLPESRIARIAAKNGFEGLLDVVAREDFDILPLLQRNFTQSPHAEVVFGRHEAALTYRHKMFKAMVGE